MGCDELKTYENEDFQGNEYDNNSYNNNNNNNDNDNGPKDLCRKIFTGFLQQDLKFEDCLIKTQEELDEKLRSYIPTKIKKENSNALGFNTKDDILTKSANIDFEQNYLIALNGINKVLKVEEMDGNYAIYHDNQPGRKNKYIALVVARIGLNPKFIFASPKKPFLY